MSNILDDEPNLPELTAEQRAELDASIAKVVLHDRRERKIAFVHKYDPLYRARTGNDPDMAIDAAIEMFEALEKYDGE